MTLGIAKSGLSRVYSGIKSLDSRIEASFVSPIRKRIDVAESGFKSVEMKLDELESRSLLWRAVIHFSFLAVGNGLALIIELLTRPEVDRKYYFLYYAVATFLCTTRGYLVGVISSMIWFYWVRHWLHPEFTLKDVELNRFILHLIVPLLFSWAFDMRRRTLRKLENSEKKLAANNLRLEERVEEEKRKFKVAYDQLLHAQKLESVGVLAGGVAHDYNNLLTIILGNINMIGDDLPKDHAYRPMIDTIINAVDRAALLSRQLLGYAGKGKIVVKAIDISKEIESIASLINSTVKGNVELKLDLATNLPPILADRGQIQQVIMNLVINGVEAIGELNGTLTLSTRGIDAGQDYLDTLVNPRGLEPGKYVSIEVVDSGCGMDEATVARIFDPFFTTKFTGRGLGLSAVLGILNEHGGALKVDSRPGRGTAFKLLFPAAEGESVSEIFETMEENLRGNERVLIVEDEEALGITTKRIFEWYGYEVELAPNGKFALELLKKSPRTFQIMLLDLVMPVMNGEETLRALPETETQIRVILTSGHNDKEVTRLLQDKRVKDFIAKPYSTKELLSLVKKTLRETQTAAGK